MDADPNSGIPKKWLIPGPHNDHATMYIGYNEFINAQGGRVQIQDYAYFHSRCINFQFVNMKTACSSQKQAAKNWAMDRLGADYQVFLNPFVLA